VLFHGGSIPTDTWNRLAKRTVYPPGGLLGPHCWDGTASFLEAHGHPSFAPALGDENTPEPTDRSRNSHGFVRFNSTPYNTRIPTPFSFPPQFITMMNDLDLKHGIRKVWDSSAINYDAIPGHQIGIPGEKNAWMRELGRDLPPTPKRVLDIGCGTGAMGLLFAGMGHRVAGIDLSPEMVAKARKNAEEQNLSLELHVGDAEHLPFEDNSFDVIVSRHLLWTLPHPEVALKDWHRVLVPGGMVLVIDGVWNDGSPTTRMKLRISSWLTRIFEPEKTHPASYNRNLRCQLPCEGGVPRELLHAWLKRLGFSTLQVRDLGYIRELQKITISWYRRFAVGRNYYLISAIKPET
jgi:ubiquinone/menaquinone biosynthesis C-methylase UbiE